MPKKIKSAKKRSKSRNEADSLAFRAEKALKEYKDKLPNDVTSDVQSKIDAVKKALESKDMDSIKSTKNELEEHMQHIGEAMAKAGAAAGGGAQQGQPHAEHGGFDPSQGQEQPSQGKKDDIEEAEVEIIDDEKNK